MMIDQTGSLLYVDLLTFRRWQAIHLVEILNSLHEFI